MPSENRAEILRLAVESIDAGGEAAIRVHHLAERAGVTQPVVYHYFGSREGLVIAAQVERYTRYLRSDVERNAPAVAAARTKAQFRKAFLEFVGMVLSSRSVERWVRLDAIGSAYARPELAAALAQAQDALVVAMVELLEPARERGWFRPGIDLRTAITWQHGMMLSRAFIEHGAEQFDVDEWDRLTVASCDAAFFGSSAS